MSLTGLSRNSNDVTTPKLPPPPRMAQKRSASSFSLATWKLPSAVTTSAAEQVVQGQPQAPGEVADATAEGEPSDAGGRDDPAGRREPEGVGRRVQVTPGRAAGDPGRPGQRVDPDPAHRGQVDDHAAVTRAEARDAVRATTDGDGQPVVGGEPDGAHHVAGVRGLDDDGRALVDHPVADRAGDVVAGVVRSGDGPADLFSQGVELCGHLTLLVARTCRVRAAGASRGRGEGRQGVTWRGGPRQGSGFGDARPGRWSRHHSDCVIPSPKPARSTLAIAG